MNSRLLTLNGEEKGQLLRMYRGIMLKTLEELIQNFAKTNCIVVTLQLTHDTGSLSLWKNQKQTGKSLLLRLRIESKPQTAKQCVKINMFTVRFLQSLLTSMSILMRVIRWKGSSKKDMKGNRWH